MDALVTTTTPGRTNVNALTTCAIDVIVRVYRPAKLAAKSAQQIGSEVAGPLEDEQGRRWTAIRNVKTLFALDGEAFVYASYVTIMKRLPDSGGLVNYLKELQSGVGKLEIISRLKDSTERQRIGVQLSGSRSIMLRNWLLSLLAAPGR